MDSMATHMSGVYQGTVTHMAPEILMEGRASKAADVSCRDDALNVEPALS